LLTMVGAPGAGTRTLLWQEDSVYHSIRIEQGEEARYLYFGRTLQSAMTLSDTTALRLLHLRYATLGSAFRPEARKMLMVGLGGGSIPKKLNSELPDLEIDAVDLDPAVIRLAGEYFNLRESRHLRLHAQDGRSFLEGTDDHYGIILLDAFSPDATPFRLATREFFKLARRRLTQNGVVVANLVGAVTGPRSQGVRSFVATARHVFPQVYVFAVRWTDLSTDTVQNVIVVASSDRRRMEISEIVTRAAGLGTGLFPDVVQDIAAAYVEMPLADDVPILIDDGAPPDGLLRG
jgi:spermidine synthase